MPANLTGMDLLLSHFIRICSLLAQTAIIQALALDIVPNVPALTLSTGSNCTVSMIAQDASLSNDNQLTLIIALVVSIVCCDVFNVTFLTQLDCRHCADSACCAGVLLLQD